MKKRNKFSTFVFILLLISSCCDKKNVKYEDVKINTKSLNHFQEIFQDFSYLNKKFKFDKGVLSSDIKFDTNYVKEKDIKNLIFFKLFEDTNSFTILVDTNKCFASVLSELNNNYYPTNSLIFPYDFSFLNEDDLNLNIKCKNYDKLLFREVSYDKNLIGEWLLDSCDSYSKNYKSDNFKLSKVKITKDKVILNDSIVNSYSHNGYDLELYNSNYKFFKIFMGSESMILINVFNESYEEYFFTKKL